MLLKATLRDMLLKPCERDWILVSFFLVRRADIDLVLQIGRAHDAPSANAVATCAIPIDLPQEFT